MLGERLPYRAHGPARSLPHTTHTDSAEGRGSGLETELPGAEKDEGGVCPGEGLSPHTPHPPWEVGFPLSQDRAGQVCGRVPLPGWGWRLCQTIPPPAPSTQEPRGLSLPPPGTAQPWRSPTEWLTSGTGVNRDRRAGPWGGGGGPASTGPRVLCTPDKKGGPGVYPPGRTTGGQTPPGPSGRAAMLCQEVPWHCLDRRSEPAGIWSGWCDGSDPGLPVAVSDTHLKDCSIYIRIS